MVRNRNTNREGNQWTKEELKAVWEKATIVAGNDPNVFRKDRCSAWIAHADYGNKNSVYGWEIDHNIPV